MKISINWLKDYVEIHPEDIKTLIDNLTIRTAELEGVEYKGANISNLVVGQIVALENHPNSTKLHLLKVNVGNEVLDIVCGAPNVKLNAKVVVVKEGGSVVGMKIKQSKVGGYLSSGMCCAEDELGIGDDSDGIIILPDDCAVGADAKELLQIDDIILEIDNKSLTNRPDLWGHYGFAREISALLNRPLKPLTTYDLSESDSLKDVGIVVETKNCLKYTAQKIENITKKLSPNLIKTRLKYCDFKSINLLADLTNYIMLEIGQPMHAFDADIVKGIIVKELEKNTKFVTLDKTERTLPANTVAICDQSGWPVAVAGVMGGINSGITENTTNLLLESATFAASNIRKTASALGLRTDASNRYEKSLDTNLCKTAAARFVYLLKQIDPEIKVASRFSSIANYEYSDIKIELKKDYLEKYMGEAIEPQTVTDILKKLEFKVEFSNDIYNVTVPSFRATKDISIPADLVEEVARMYGYINISPKANKMPVSPNFKNEFHSLNYDVKYYLANKFNYNEIHTYVWKNNAFLKVLGLAVKDNVKIKNSLSQEYSDLRDNVSLSLMEKVVENKSDFDNINIFEIAKCFKGFDSSKNVIEKTSLALVKASYTKTDEKLYTELASEIISLVNHFKNQNVSFETAEFCAFAHPIHNSKIFINSECVGELFVINPNVSLKIDKKLHIAICEIDFKKFADIDEAAKKFIPVVKFPTTNVDLSFLADLDVPYSQIAKIIKDINYKTLQSFKLVEVFEDAEKLGNKKSVTIKFVLGSHNKTLQAQDVSIFKDRVISVIEKHNIKFRY